MAGCEAQIFDSVTPQQFACIAQKAQEESGLALSGNGGTVSAQGISINWIYDPVSQALTIQCVEKPFLVLCAMIHSTIQNLVDGCLRA